MTNKTSKDGKVVFEQENHTYYLGEKRLRSVTSFIKQYKNEFDTDKMATMYAMKHGMDKEVVIKMWYDKGQKALDQGHSIHSIFEDYINTNEIVKRGDYEKEKVAEKFINDMFKTQRLEPIETEMIVYNDSLAGQIDCIAKDSKGNHYILDWKTNSKIDTFSYGKLMLPPYHNFNDSVFYHYSLQLSIYKELCTEYEVKNCYIVHIDEHDYSMIKILDMPILC